uniref:C-type lectin domain-containing protein n=1 Tax=Caenorhabditis japonica TaxID=281687 RepID=A0A8R1HXB5_CAEJA
MLSSLILSLLSVFLVNADVACNYGDTEFDGYCYQFVNQRVLYPDAQAYCATQGGTVVRIRGPTDAKWIVSTAITEFQATYGNFWIGLHKEEDQFIWDDGADISYLNWAAGYPFSGYDYVGAQLSNAKWISVASSKTLPFVCYYEKGQNGKQSTTSVVTEPVGSVCDESDLLLENRCYSFNPTLLSHDRAQQACEATGKTLAIFDDVAQINFVTSTAISEFAMTYGTFWIGLKKNEKTGNFYWANGKINTLKRWIPGYPFQQQSVVSLQVSNGKWKTSDQTTSLPSVCSGYLQ